MWGEWYQFPNGDAIVALRGRPGKADAHLPLTHYGRWVSPRVFTLTSPLAVGVTFIEGPPVGSRPSAVPLNETDPLRRAVYSQRKSAQFDRPPPVPAGSKRAGAAACWAAPALAP